MNRIVTIYVNNGTQGSCVVSFPLNTSNTKHHTKDLPVVMNTI